MLNTKYFTFTGFKKGFSLTESLIVISLFLLLAGIGMSAYFGYYQSSLVNMEADNILTMVKQARFKALKNPSGSDYGIYFSLPTHSLIEFRGTYSPNSPENIVLPLQQLSILSTAFAPDPETARTVLFQYPTGKTDNIGAFTVGNGELNYTFTINGQGMIE